MKWLETRKLPSYANDKVRFVEAVQVNNISFIPPAHSSGDVVVMGNLSLLDRDWSVDRAFYVGPSGIGGIGSRYSNFGKWLEGGKAVKMPEISMLEGNPVFSNGRHRTAWFRDSGFECIPFSVSWESAREFKEKYGCLGGL
jgi:hypothetical protein